MFRIQLLLWLILAVAVPPAVSQTLTWQELPNAPYTGRHNDVYLVSAEKGWVVNGEGEIYRTVDGGITWDFQFKNASAHFRSVGFSPSRGFAGNVGYGEFGATDRSPL